MLRILLMTVVVFIAFADLRAAETPWVDHSGMLQTRIVSGSAEMANDEGVMLAWEAKLAPGWKTYWRSPGEAGLPVRVYVGEKELEPLYPLPERFELFGIHTFGYGRQLMLPFRMSGAQDGAGTVRVDFMVCKDICVPFEQAYDLNAVLPVAETSLHDFRIETWLGKVPAVDTAPMGLKIINTKVTGRPGHQKLIVDVQSDDMLSSADLMAEVNEMFHFGVPKLRLLEDGRKARLVLPAMVSSKSEDLRGRKVRLTLTDGRGHSIDRTVELTKQ